MSSSSSKYQSPYVLTPYEDPTSFGDVDFTTRLKYDIVKHAVNGPEFLRCVDSEISSKGLSSTYFRLDNRILNVVYNAEWPTLHIRQTSISL